MAIMVRCAYACIILAISLMITPSLVTAWWDQGHILVAEIARRTLAAAGDNGAASLQGIDNALAADRDYFPYHSRLPYAAVWMDKLKSTGMQAYNDWHYVDIPYAIDNVTAPTPEQQNALWAIQLHLDNIKSRTSWAWSKAFSIRCLLHIVGDVHQPLHCISRFSEKYPDGDLGGNLFRVAYNDSVTHLVINNLHSLFDSIVGAGSTAMPEPVTDTYDRLIASDADSIMTTYPSSSFAGGMITSVNFTEWADHSWNMAVKYAYETLVDGQTIDDTYRDTIRPLLKQQIALAGYRLANLLSQGNWTLNGPLPVPQTMTSSSSAGLATALAVTLGIVVALILPMAYCLGRRAGAQSATASNDMHYGTGV